MSIPDEPEHGDSFGFSLAPGDFNGDGKEDLAIGVPRDNCNTSGDGSVVVIYEDNWEWQNGLSPQYWCQGGVVEDEGEEYDNFGYALVSLPGSGALPYRRYLPTIMRGD